VATRGNDEDQAIYVISVAAELAGVHPQTLRVYERKGLVTPHRTSGNTRRYSAQDIELLRRIQELTQDGINLAGVTRILALEKDLARAQTQSARLFERLGQLNHQMQELLSQREHQSLVPFKDVRRVRRALKSDVVDEAGRRRVFAAPPVSMKFEHEESE
jgi:MerR family transcriptional regulator/heat shock protein HspR